VTLKVTFAVFTFIDVFLIYVMSQNVLILFSQAQSTSSSAMAERPRELGDFKGVRLTLRLNFRLKGYCSR